MVDDFDFIIAAVADASQDILQKHEAKQEEMYDRIEVELRGVQQALQSSVQYPLCPHHQKHQSWEMSLPNSAD
jgi:hypothetical protein